MGRKEGRGRESCDRFWRGDERLREGSKGGKAELLKDFCVTTRLDPWVGKWGEEKNVLLLRKKCISHLHRFFSPPHTHFFMTSRPFHFSRPKKYRQEGNIFSKKIMEFFKVVRSFKRRGLFLRGGAGEGLGRGGGRRKRSNFCGRLKDGRAPFTSPKRSFPPVFRSIQKKKRTKCA